MKSSLFLNDTTNIDHAFIDDLGMIVGGSFRPKFIVTGEVDQHENVVVDFSTIKKTIKKLIDDNDEGFDHKLWWITGLSLGDIEFTVDTVTITTPMLTITGPKNIVRVIDQVHLNGYLEERLQEIYPAVNITIDTTLTTEFDLHPNMNSKAHMFRYVHGLKESTSWGCQNIGHGHLSYIAANTTDQLETDLVLAKIAVELDNTIFAWNDNTGGNDADIKYTCSRGEMSMTLHDASDSCIVLGTETTIENIVNFIATEWFEELASAGVKQLYVSEGLSKGAVVDLG